jgi:hypothetical protein
MGTAKRQGTKVRPTKPTSAQELETAAKATTASTTARLKTCKQCGKGFPPKPSGTDYCSKACAHTWVRNNAFSFKTKPPWQK